MSVYSRILKDHRLWPQIGYNCKPNAHKESYLYYSAKINFCHCGAVAQLLFQMIQSLNAPVVTGICNLEYDIVNRS